MALHITLGIVKKEEGENKKYTSIYCTYIYNTDDRKDFMTNIKSIVYCIVLPFDIEVRTVYVSLYFYFTWKFIKFWHQVVEVGRSLA